MSIPKLMAAMEKYASQLQRWALAQPDRFRTAQPASTVDVDPIEMKPLASMQEPTPTMKKEDVAMDKKIPEKKPNFYFAEVIKRMPTADKRAMEAEAQPAPPKPTSNLEKPIADQPQAAQPSGAEK